jgi:hypothetical protein
MRQARTPASCASAPAQSGKPRHWRGDAFDVVAQGVDVVVEGIELVAPALRRAIPR